MNRSPPCPACGCPMLFHTPFSPPGGGPPRRRCDDCSKRTGKVVLCEDAPGGVPDA